MITKGKGHYMSDWGMNDAGPYLWTGGAGIMGRLMYHARQVQSGKRKPFSWALMFDLPIALAMGWLIYGLCVWLDLGPEPTISMSIGGGYLGPWVVDRIFALMADKYFGKDKAA